MGRLGLKSTIGVTNIGFAFAKGLNFGTMEDQAGLDFVEQMIVVGGSAVLGDDSLLVRLLSPCRSVSGMFLGTGTGFGTV